MTRRPPISTRTSTPFPPTPLFRSPLQRRARGVRPRHESLPAVSIDGAVGVQGHAPAGELTAPVQGQLAVRPARGAEQVERAVRAQGGARSEEHTSELQSLMRISYAVLCLEKKKQ